MSINFEWRLYIIRSITIDQTLCRLKQQYRILRFIKLILKSN